MILIPDEQFYGTSRSVIARFVRLCYNLFQFHKTRSARSWDIFASYILARCMGFSFTVLPSSADYVQRSHQSALTVQICSRGTFYEQYTKKKKGTSKSIY